MIINDKNHHSNKLLDVFGHQVFPLGCFESRKFLCVGQTLQTDVHGRCMDLGLAACWSKASGLDALFCMLALSVSAGANDKPP